MSFKTYFNPLVPLMCIAFIVLIIFAFTLIFDELYFSKKFHSVEDHFKLIFGFLFFGMISWIFARQLLRTTKTYLFTNNGIQEYNYLTFSSRYIQRNDIKGFRSSSISYKLMPFKQVIIYLNDGTKLDLMQFNFFNFKCIKQALIDLQYTYLGYESYKWKWFDDRYYRFDE